MAEPTLDKLTFTLSSDRTYYSVKALSTSISGEVVIPVEYEGLPVKEIRNSAFNGCLDLTSVIIPNSITSIGNYAFEWCSALTSIVIPDSVTSIGDKAFIRCESLTSVTIGNGVTSIGSSAFSSCSALTSITIPDSVTSIGSQVFSSCYTLTSITVDSLNTFYKSDGNCIIEKDTNKLITGCKNSIIPNYVTSIGNYAFYGCVYLTAVTIPDSVTSIGLGAFDECYNLTSVTIPNTVTTIDMYAFDGCSKLSSVVIPESVTTIRSNTFNWCSALTNVIIKGNPSVNSNAFNSTTKLEKIYVIEGKGYSPTDTIAGKPVEIITEARALELEREWFSSSSPFIAYIGTTPITAIYLGSVNVSNIL